jgi:gamma-glutamyltranspeptidase/glutathione hydrolase
VACGPGGDLFAILWDPKAKKVVGLNASGRAPAALTADKVKPDPDGTIPLRSPATWTIPGAVDGWFALHQRYGKLPMKQVLAAAIRYAEEGFPLSPVIAGAWERSAAKLQKYPGFADVYMPGGKTPRAGEIFKNPALAKTLRLLAGQGRDAYYKGPIAQALVEFGQANGGTWTMEDFAAAKATWDEPISTDYHGYTVYELPPPGQGLAALQLLNVLESFDLKSMGRASPDFWHVMVEAKKVIFADRARYYADPGFAKVPVAQLLSKAYAKKRAALIDLARVAQENRPGDPAELGGTDTTYLCAADGSGMMVSLIQSNYVGFGSGYAVPELGFGLHNRGALFSLKDGPNKLEPGKRPFHTIIPALVAKDGKPVLVFGVMGGDMQPQGHAQVLVNLLDLGADLQQAGDAPRFYHAGSPEPTGTPVKEGGGVLHLEPEVPAAIADALRARGHRIEPIATSSYGGYQAIWRDPQTGVYAGATEKRKDGCALGY